VPDHRFVTPVDFRRVAGTPVHQQIEAWFLRLLARGELGPGDRLPREKDLAAAFGVSRMTLRQALGALEARGLLERIPGRLGGTFVVEPPIQCDLTGLTGFTEQLRRANVRAGARLIDATTLLAARPVARALRLDRDAEVHRVVRVRTADGRPLALERSYFPAEAFPDLLQQSLTGSLYALLGRRYRHQPRTATEYLDPVTAEPDEADLLGVRTGSPLMMITRTAYTAWGRPIEYARDLLRPDRLRVLVRSGLDAGDPAELDRAANHPHSS
jgi:GntR family transcriptional regulator